MRLPSVTSLQVGAIDQEMVACCAPVFTAAWKTFGPNLRKLSLEGELHRIQELPSIQELTQLRELRLKFMDVYYSNSLHAINTRLCNLIQPALKTLGPTLESLSISFESSNVGAGYLNLSDFVDQLEPLPQLRSLTMHIPHPKVSDPIRLKRLLHNQASTLRDVSLDLSGLSDAPSGFGEGRLVPLMTELLSDERLFTDLESFTFSPTTSRAFDIVTSYLARSADTLTHLTLVDQYLSEQQVATLVGVFSGRGAHRSLRTLTLKIELFHPHLLALLASTFAGLQELSLRGLDWGVEDSIVNERNWSWLHKLVR